MEHKNICQICKKYTQNICAVCQTVYYCSKNCQLFDWLHHKQSCLSRDKAEQLIKTVMGSITFELQKKQFIPIILIDYLGATNEYVISPPLPKKQKKNKVVARKPYVDSNKTNIVNIHFIHPQYLKEYFDLFLTPAINNLTMINEVSTQVQQNVSIIIKTKDINYLFNISRDQIILPDNGTTFIENEVTPDYISVLV